MVIDIFIKSYHKDFGFLNYCLQSIHKYITGYRNIIIALDNDDKTYIDNLQTRDEKILFFDKECSDGYLWQQVIKLEAYKYTDADYILFVDSDCIFFKHTNLQEHYFNGDKTWLMRTRYSEVGTDWQAITAKAIGFVSEWEYMRQMPLIYRRDTLIKINRNFPELKKYIIVQPKSSFSEFNFIGQYIEKNEMYNYHIVDTRDYIYSPIAVQFWSWGGVEAVKNEINKIL